MPTKRRGAKEANDAPETSDVQETEARDAGAVEVPVEQEPTGEAEVAATGETEVTASGETEVAASGESDGDAASEAEEGLAAAVAQSESEDDEDEDEVEDREEDEELAIQDDDDDDDDEEDDDEEDEEPVRQSRIAASRGESRDRGAAPGRDFTHLNESGRARMVDVGEKPDTRRAATARALVRMRGDTLELIRNGGIYKGDVLAVAQVAGVMAAKRTPDVIPLCHPLLLSGVDLEFQFEDRLPAIEITATVRTTGPTGAEMEALTAVSAAALTIYDMCKSVDREMVIDRVRLVHKAGGKSGEFRRSGERPRYGDDRPRQWEQRPRQWEQRPRQWEDRPRQWEDRPRWDDRPQRGTWPQHPRRRPDDNEGGPPRPPRDRYEREPRTGPPPDQRWRRDDQRQGFDRPPRRPWRPDDPRDRGRGRHDGD